MTADLETVMLGQTEDQLSMTEQARWCMAEPGGWNLVGGAGESVLI